MPTQLVILPSQDVLALVNSAEPKKPETLNGAQSTILRCMGHRMSAFLCPFVFLSLDEQEGLILLFSAC